MERRVRRRVHSNSAARYSGIWNITSLSCEINWGLPRPNQTHTHTLHTHTRIHMHAHTHTRIHAHTRTHARTHTHTHTHSRKHMERKWLWWHFSSKNVTCSGGRPHAGMAFAHFHTHTRVHTELHAHKFMGLWCTMKDVKEAAKPPVEVCTIHYILQNTQACLPEWWGVSVLPDVNMAQNRLRHHG